MKNQCSNRTAQFIMAWLARSTRWHSLQEPGAAVLRCLHLPSLFSEQARHMQAPQHGLDLSRFYIRSCAASENRPLSACWLSVSTTKGTIKSIEVSSCQLFSLCCTQKSPKDIVCKALCNCRAELLQLASQLSNRRFARGSSCSSSTA